MSKKYPGGFVTNLGTVGYSVYFDGSGDYLTLPSNTAFAVDSGNFTIECWVYMNAYTTGAQTRIFYPSNNAQNFDIGGTTNSPGKLSFFNGAGLSSAAGVVPLNAWTHIACVRSGTTVTLYANGVSVASSTISTTSPSAVSVNIGGDGGGSQLNGYISNYRVLKGTALYTANFTPPTQLLNVTNTSLLTCNSPAIVDQSSNNFTITVNGNTAVSTFTPFPVYNAYNPALGASTPGVWTLDQALQAAATRQWNMYDPYFNLTTLYLPGNGTNGAQNNTFLDSSTNNFTITRNGNTTQGTFSPFSQTGWSNYFDGSTAYLSLSDNAAFELGSGDFTLETWVNFSALPSSNGYQATLISKWGNSSNQSYEFYLYNNAGTYQIYLTYSTNGASATNVGVNWTPTVGVWYHVAVVRSGSNLYFFVNGTQQGSTGSISGTIFDSSSATMQLGSFNGAANSYLNGYMSNARVTKGGALYTGSFTPSTIPLTTTVSSGTVSLLTCQSNRFVDNSTNAFAITINGTPSVQAFSPFAPTAAYSAATVGGSGYFDGTGDYLTVPDNAAFDIGSGNFSIECWVYPTASANVTYLISQVVGSTAAGSYVLWIDGSGYPTFYSTTGGTTSTRNDITSGTLLALRSWTHLCICRSGSTLSLYQNGTRVATQTYSSTIFNSTNNIGIGGDPTGSVLFTGYISNVRLVKGSSAYDATQTTITIPTAPPTAITNTSLLCNFTNAGITDATSKNDLETVGNAQISTAQSKFGGSSMYFDGTGDYLRVPYSKQWALGGDFTIECWLYWTAHDSFGGIVGCANSNTGAAIAAGWFFDFNGATNKLQFEGQGGVAIVTTNDIPSGQWNHIAVVRSGSTITHYLNGTANGSGTSSTVFDSNTDPLLVGVDRGFAAEITGYIDDLRITRYARYIGNFTPPTSALQQQ